MKSGQKTSSNKNCFPGKGKLRLRGLLTVSALALFVMWSGLAFSATWTVGRITDDPLDGSGSTGSLRWAVSQADFGDTIQFADSLAGQTIVSTISAAEGADQKNLTFVGPSTGTVTISKPGESFILRGGALGENIRFDGMGGGDVIHPNYIDRDVTNIASDFYNNKGSGWGAGLRLNSSAENVSGTFEKNENASPDNNAFGGGLYVSGSVTGDLSGIFRQNTVSAGLHEAMGGGVVVYGRINKFSGQARENIATAQGEGYTEVLGGGIYADKIGGIESASIVRNEAKAISTESGQSSRALGGGVYIHTPTEALTITDSTLTFNTAEAGGSDARAEGGAIFVNTMRGTTHQIILNTTSGKNLNINFNKAIVNDVERASGIHFGRETLGGNSQSNASLTIQGQGNTYMMDPVTVDLNNGKSFTMTKTGTGGFNWGGDNVLDAAGGSIVTLGPSTQFYSGFSMDNGGTNTSDNVVMNLNGGGVYYQVAALNTTAGPTDSITFGNTTLNVSNSSYLMPYGVLQLGDNTVLNVDAGSGIDLNNEALLRITGNSRINGGALTVGAGETLAVDLSKTLTLGTATTLALNGGTLSVGVGSGSASGKIVSLNTTTAPDFSGSNTLNISEWIPGSYTVLEAEAAMAAGAPGTFTSFTVGGNTVDPSAYSLSAALSGDNKSLLVNAALNQDSSLKTWGGASGTWNYTNTNWLPGTSQFVLGDLAVFDGTGATDAGLAVTVGGGAETIIETAGMSITDGSYTFTGGKIVGHTDISEGGDITPTGALSIAGSGRVVFNNAVEFEKGLTVTALRTSGILANPDVTLADYSGGKIVVAEGGDPLHYYEGNFSGKVTISGITATASDALRGGAMRIHNAAASRVDILPGSLIEDNELTVTNTTPGYGEALGGGVYANYLGTVAGTISRNQAQVTTDSTGGYTYAEGGGLYVTDRVEEIAGLISGNTASGNANVSSQEVQVRGGGVFNSGTSSEQGIRLLSGTVENNRAEATGGTGTARNMAYGGGVYGFMPTFTGIVADNTAIARAEGSRQAWTLGGGINSFNVTELAGDVTGNLAEADATSGAMAYAIGGGAYISFMSGADTTTISKGTYSGNKAVAVGDTAFAQGGGLFVDTFQPFGATDIALVLDPQRGAVTFENNVVSLNGVESLNGLHFGRSPQWDGSLNDSSGNVTLQIKDSLATGNLISISDGITTDINNGKTFTLTQSGGEFLWGGTNLFDSAGGDFVALSDGEMRLADGFSLDRGTANGGTGFLDFAVNGGNLRSEGAVTSLKSTALSVASGGTLTVDLGSTLILDAASTFNLNNGILSVGVGASDASGKIVSENTTTAPVFTGSNTLDISDWIPGDYTVLEAAAAMATDVPETFQDFTVGGNAIDPATMSISAVLANSDMNLQVTATLLGASGQKTWGGAPGIWNYTNTNWKEGATTGKTFVLGDLAFFDGTGADGVALDVIVGGTAVETAGMKITDGSYTFSGGKIVGRTDISKGTNITPTGRLEISGAGTTATFENTISFENGIDIGTGSELILAQSENLSLSTGISGTGTVTKTGTGELTVSGVNTAAGTFTQSSGNVRLASTWAGDFVQESGTVFTSDDNARISGNAIFSGTVTPTDALTITGNAVFDGATIGLGALTATSANTITVAGTTSFTGTIVSFDAANASTGTYTLISYGSSASSASEITISSSNLASNLTASWALGTTVLTYTITEKPTDPPDPASIVLTFNGSGIATAVNWNQGAENIIWLTESGEPASFQNKNAVIFGDNTAGPTTMNVEPAGVTITSMNVNNSAGNDYTYAGGNITSTDAFTKTGAGNVIFENTANFASATISRGGLIVNGHFNAPTTIQRGAMLGGSGTVSSANLASGAIVSPGFGNGHIATLTLDSDTSLGGVILEMDLGGSGTSDTLRINGTADLSAGNITLNLTTWEIGTFTLVSANTVIGSANSFNPVQFQSEELTGRQAATLSGSGTAVTLNTFISNLSMTWAGQTNGQWSAASENWNGRDTRFMDGDAVTFDGTSSNTVITVDAGGVRVASMTVSGGTHTFGGGVISSTTDTTFTHPSQQLLVTGAGTSAFFNTTLDFANGIVVADGATFGGNAVVTSGLIIRTGSTISPGNSIGTISASSITFEPGSFYDVEVNPADTTSNDLLAVTGKAVLGGASVRHIGLDGNYNPIGTWTILTADEIEGTFGNVNSDFAFLTPSLIHEARAVKLQLARNAASFESAAKTRNQKATAIAIESQGQGNQPHDAILGLSAAADMPAIFNSLDGEIHADIHGPIMDADRLFADNQKRRLSGKFSGSANVAAGAFGEGTDFWFSIDGYKNTVDRTSNTGKTELKGWGASLGVEREVCDWTLGGAFRYGDSEYKVKDRSSKADLDSFNFGIYAGRPIGDHFNVKLGAGYGFHQADSRRFVAFMGERLKADYDLHSFQVFAEAGYEKNFENVSVEPYVGLAWNFIENESFTEKGGSSALRVKSESNDNLTSELGMRTQYRPSENVTINGDLNWQHLFGDENPEGRFAFTGNRHFTIEGAPMDRDSIGLGVDLDFALKDNFSIRAGYHGRFGEDSDSHVGFLNLEFSF